MEAPTRSSAEKGKAPNLLGVPAVAEKALTLKDPSPTGQQPAPSAQLRCLQAIKTIQDHYKTLDTKSPQAFMVENGGLIGLFVNPSAPGKPASAKLRISGAITGSIPDSRARVLTPLQLLLLTLLLTHFQLPMQYVTSAGLDSPRES